MFNKLLTHAIDEVLLTNWSGLRTGIVSVTIAPPCTGSRCERGRGGREGGREGGAEGEPQPASLRFAPLQAAAPAQGHQPGPAWDPWQHLQLPSCSPWTRRPRTGTRPWADARWSCCKGSAESLSKGASLQSSCRLTFWLWNIYFDFFF